PFSDFPQKPSATIKTDIGPIFVHEPNRVRRVRDFSRIGKVRVDEPLIANAATARVLRSLDQPVEDAFWAVGILDARAGAGTQGVNSPVALFDLPSAGHARVSREGGLLARGVRSVNALGDLRAAVEEPFSIAFELAQLEAAGDRAERQTPAV